MGRKIYGFFAIVCIVLLVFATVFAAVRIGGEIEDNSRRARSEFDQLVQHLSLSWNNSLEDEAFRQSIRDAFWEAPTLMAILVSGTTGPELAMEKESGLLAWTAGIPRLNPSIAYSADGLSGTLRTANGDNVSLEALAVRYDYQRMRSILAQALVILISSVVLALVILFIARSAGAGYSAGEDRSLSKRPSGKTKAQAAGAAEVDRNISIPLDESIPGLSPDVMPENDILQNGDPEPVGNPQEPYRQEVDQHEVYRHGAIPEGLYNPQSGIGWEAYLPERLNAELHRAASFEQDLVLLVWDSIDSCQGGDGRSAGQLPETGEAMGKKGTAAGAQRAVLAGELVRFFSFRDLSFEYGANGASVILPNIDLDHGLRMAEEFIQQIARREPGDLSSKALRCGVASRHGRLLEPGRLLMEAEGALKRACANPDAAVIAFKSDPERYRELLKRE